MKYYRALKRAWKWFVCDHRNSLIGIDLDTTREVCFCQECGRFMWFAEAGEDLKDQKKYLKFDILGLKRVW